MVDRPVDYSRLDAGRDCNYWELDRTFRSWARRTYPDEEYDWAASRLAEWGGIVGETIAPNAEVLDRDGPTLHTLDRHGDLANRVEYHPLQTEHERLAYGRGIVSDSFRAPPGRDEPLGLLHHLTMTGLLGYADGGFACPVAMTGGAALVLEKFDDGALDAYFEGLTSRDPDDVIEGAMFLTEKQGGSDVGATETVAEPTGERHEGTEVYALRGEKWFCSNIDAEGTLALARRPDAPEGTAGLSLFLVPHTARDGSLNDQRYRRLKDKLGTTTVPTGEVEFHGAEAYLVGEPESGFRYMTEMLNLERLHNAFGAIANMGRALIESKVHAANREAFGTTIDQHPLLRRDLVEMAVDHEAATAFTFAAGKAFDRRERAAGEDREAYQLMRVLIPVAKYKTGRLAVETASYACEVLGGNGYVEGFGTERLLRDAQVLPIWEGTSNILSLDLLRALEREDAHEAVLPWIDRRVSGVDDDRLATVTAELANGFASLQDALGHLATASTRDAQHNAKRLADLVFDVVAGTLLAERGQAALARGNARPALVAERFVTDRFATGDARGITAESAVDDATFDAVVRYARPSPDDVSFGSP